MKALIIGGGIGGLATAVALDRIGVDPLVCERAQSLGEVGAGLSLWSNAVKALRRLGLEDPVLAFGSVLERAVTMTSDGSVLDTSPIGELSRRAGAPSICVHRADLQRCLIRAIPTERLRVGCACVGFDEDDGGVTARFADGSTERGDLLIGADGIHSAVRAQTHGPAAPRDAGYLAWRGIAEFRHPELPFDGSILALGSGTQVGLFPCKPGKTYWFVTSNRPRAHMPEPTRSRSDALETLQGWWSPITAVIEATPEGAVLANRVLDRPPVGRWGDGRVTFVGDAIHPTTPNLGQGACQALEDAVVLAACLRGAAGVAPALREYERRRMRRTAWVVRRSRSLGGILQWQRPALVVLRTRMLRMAASRRAATRLLDELMSYDPPELPGSPRT